MHILVIMNLSTQVARVWAARLALGLAMSAAGSAASSNRLQILEEAGVTAISEATGSGLLHRGGNLGEGADLWLPGPMGDDDDNGGQGHPIARDSPFWAGGPTVEAEWKRNMTLQQTAAAVVSTGGGDGGGSGGGMVGNVVPDHGRSPSRMEAPATSLGVGPRLRALSAISSRVERPLTVITSRGDTIRSDLRRRIPSSFPLASELSCSFRCGSVVHCTNAYSSALLPELEGKLVPVRNQVGLRLCLDG